MQPVGSWQTEPQRALDSLALRTPRPRRLRARPSRWGDSEPILVADLGHLELAEEIPYGSQQRRDLELQVTRGLLAHFGQHLTAVADRGYPGASDRRLELWFDDPPAAAAARHAAAEDQLVRLHAVPGKGDVAVPVQLSAGRLHCQHSCIIIHGLPFAYSIEGLTQTLLDCAGCPRETYVVRGEFLGDLPGDLAASGGHLVGSGRACLAYVETPDDDRHLSRLPKRFFIDGDTRINITRPGQMRQPSQAATFQVAQPSLQPPRRPGPRPIRQRQRTARARTPEADAPQAVAAPSTQLRELEARVQASRAPGGDRSGLGRTTASRPAQARDSPRFRPASDTQPAAPMDCTPPAGAEILPAASQTQRDMDIDTHPAPSQQTGALPMEWETPACPASPQPQRRRTAPGAATEEAAAMDCDGPPIQASAQPPAQSPPPLELSGVSSTRIEECMEWLAGHTHFSPVQCVRAIRLLHRCSPLALISPGDTSRDRDIRHELICDVLRSIHGRDSLPDQPYGLPPLTSAEMAESVAQPAAPPAPRRDTPACPPGVPPRAAATRAAHHAAQVALAGLPTPRRSSRARQPPARWWEHQGQPLPPQPPPQPQPPEHRRSTGTSTEGPPTRRPSRP